ncbi:hypothetical protein [Shewanella xiamenensis]|uniref:hypothetical protein n=1 Tax=Shewanella xiamenensis TaxID=332186 RepID=UPI001CC569FE|nr:hypothetical protein [Shewanella xiamenensis]BDA63023.1 hypothetical protein NUITMVS1_44860 [Shewanella xiamenensis]
MKVDKVIRLPREDEGGIGIVRMGNFNIVSSLSRRKAITRKRFMRKKPVTIQNLENGLWILRYAMGNSGNLSLTKSQIAIDYDGIQQLGLTLHTNPVNLKVTDSSQLEIFLHFWLHPDLNIRISMRMGAIGLFLGAIGFGISLITIL